MIINVTQLINSLIYFTEDDGDLFSGIRVSKPDVLQGKECLDKVIWATMNIIIIEDHMTSCYTLTSFNFVLNVSKVEMLL